MKILPNVAYLGLILKKRFPSMISVKKESDFNFKT